MSNSDPNSSNETPFALEELLLSAISGEATAEEVELLNRSLSESSQLRSAACQFLCDDSLATQFFAESEEAESLRKQLEDAHPPAGPAKRDELVYPNSRVFRFLNRHGVAVAAIAALLLIGLFIHNVTLQTKLNRLHRLTIVPESEIEGEIQRGQGKLADNAGKDNSQDEVIGRVSGLSDPVWSEGVKPLGFGERIRQGQTLELEGGVVELLLASGAKVTIEGPAHFEATSALETTLTRGKIAAAAPRVARGYTVLTPTAELVDIGTQFGVLVEESGDSEVHVFDGDVVGRSRLVNASDQLLHARQDEGMRFESKDVTPKRINARVKDFVRHVTRQRSPDELPPIPLTDALSLWYAADMSENVEVGERVGTWRDLLIGENDFADNAWQFDEVRRPAFVHDGAGRPAWQFDGWSTSMATSPIETTEQQTMFIVCAPAPINYANEHHGQMLLKYGSTPASLELSVLKNLKVRGWVWPGPGIDNVGVLEGGELADDRPTVIAYQYNSEDNVAKLWVNGQLQGTCDAPVKLQPVSQRFIGSHADLDLAAKFFGNLYEVIVFDADLDDGQLSQFDQYFATRYSME